jgi:hypothetical protein
VDTCRYRYIDGINENPSQEQIYQTYKYPFGVVDKGEDIKFPCIRIIPGILSHNDANTGFYKPIIFYAFAGGLKWTCIPTVIDSLFFYYYGYGR